MGLKANELRIGNYIEFDGLLCIVETIDEQGATVKIPKTKENEWIDLFQFSNIALTEKWLVKFGFEKKTYQHLTLYYYSLKVLSHGEIEFHPKDHGFNLDIGTTTGYQFGTTEIKSVHQLQNLYFALTGNELTHQKIN